MADGESAERAAAGSFSEAQLEAIAGVVQRLLDKALSERGSRGSSGPASEEREAADKSRDATSGKLECERARVCMMEAYVRSCSSGGGAGNSRQRWVRCRSGGGWGWTVEGGSVCRGHSLMDTALPHA